MNNDMIKTWSKSNQDFMFDSFTWSFGIFLSIPEQTESQYIFWRLDHNRAGLYLTILTLQYCDKWEEERRKHPKVKYFITRSPDYLHTDCFLALSMFPGMPPRLSWRLPGLAEATARQTFVGGGWTNLLPAWQTDWLAWREGEGVSGSVQQHRDLGALH